MRASVGGRVITDDGSTMSHLRTAGAATDSPSFLAAWDRIARPASAFVPGVPGTEGGEITAWATNENIGVVLNLVALAAVRAEGLAFIREREGERFTTKILRRITDLMSSSAVAARGLVRVTRWGCAPAGASASPPRSSPRGEHWLCSRR